MRNRGNRLAGPARGPGRGSIRRVKAAGGRWVYQAEWQDAAGRRRRKLLSTDRRAAERMLANFIRDRDLELAGLGVETSQELHLEDLVDRFIADKSSHCSEAYVQRAKDCLERVLQAINAVTVRDLRPEAMLEYRRKRLRDGVTNRTINMEVTVTKTLLNWSVRNGLLGQNPIAGVGMLPQGKANQKRERRALSDDEIRRLLAASRRLDAEKAARRRAEKTIAKGTRGRPYANRNRQTRVPQTPLWLTLLETGGRFGETVQTVWGDFDEARGVLTFRAGTTKSKKERALPIRDSLVRELKKLRLAHHAVNGRLPRATDPIFLMPLGEPWNENRRNALRSLRKTLEEADIPLADERDRKVDIHALRHTYASRLARAGVPLQKAQHLLGHSDPKLTAAIYTHLETEDLRSAVESLPELGLGPTNAHENGRKAPSSSG